MNALILKVMDRIDSLDVGVIAVLLEVTVKEHRHHARLPVIAVENIRLEVHEVAHEVQNRSLIEAITLDIENIIDIYLVKVEVVFVIDEVENNAVYFKREQTRIKRSPSHMDHLPSEELEFVAVLNLDLLVERDNNTSINALLIKLYRQAAYNVSEAPDFNERAALGRCEQYFDVFFHNQIPAPFPITIG